MSAAKYREYNELEGPIVSDEAKSESLMPQLEATQKMAAMLCEEIARLSDRLSPICQLAQPEESIQGALTRNARAEPAPAVVAVFRLKEILSNCDHQIRSIQMRLGV